MYTLPIQQNTAINYLNAWFQYQVSTQRNGFNRLQQFFRQVVDFSNNDSNFDESHYAPLSTTEEQRWLSLERIAKSENLYGTDLIEHSILLEIKVYQRVKADNPGWHHAEILRVAKLSL